jgi:hypothetical protein
VQKINPALQFYQRMGYKIIRENDDDFIMLKDLEKLKYFSKLNYLLLQIGFNFLTLVYNQLQE